MHGACYLTRDRQTNANPNVQTIAPLRMAGMVKTDIFALTCSKFFCVHPTENQLKTIRTHNHINNYYFNMFGEQGLSVHITENGEEVLIGAVGVYEWRGTMIRYRTKRRTSYHDNGIDIPNPSYWNIPQDSYFGYALASGYFEGSRLNRILYVASAPQANVQQGMVYIFDIIDYRNDKSIKIYHTFTTDRMGEYFGYALAAEDFNGDGFYDLAICAPLYSKENSYDDGAVYIYLNMGDYAPGRWTKSFASPSLLVSKHHEGGGRFGSSISRLGDINEDGYKGTFIFYEKISHGALEWVLTKISDSFSTNNSFRFLLLSV